MLEKIPIPFESFKEKLENNSKILFSGIFGSGKTTFINDFFDNNEKYESIHIYPVNYSIASNEDIFELIKYDILFQLIGKVPKEDFLKLEIPYQLTLFTYLTSSKDLESKLDFLASFLSFAGKYGSATFKIYEQLKCLKDNYIKFHNQFQEDNFDKVKDYLEVATNKKGHIYEEDFFTEIIRSLVSVLKEKEGKQIVLVIDDLDRLDPDHIFRILNIFSAHIDFLRVENDNKFDFDKVVLVCDYTNLERIYIHKYGLDTDFKGYINKFYNSTYWYDSSIYIEEIISTYLNQIKTGSSNNFFSDSTRLGGVIKYIFKHLLKNRIITFRELRMYSKVFDLNQLGIIKHQKDDRRKSIINRYNLNVELVIYFFIVFFDNKSELEKALFNVSHLPIEPYDYNDDENLDKICELLLLINHKKYYDSYADSDIEKSFHLNYNGYTFKCKSISNGYYRAVVCDEVIKKGDGDLNYFDILNKATNIYLNYLEL